MKHQIEKNINLFDMNNAKKDGPGPGMSFDHSPNDKNVQLSDMVTNAKKAKDSFNFIDHLKESIKPSVVLHGDSSVDRFHVQYVYSKIFPEYGLPCETVLQNIRIPYQFIEILKSKKNWICVWDNIDMVPLDENAEYATDGDSGTGFKLYTYCAVFVNQQGMMMKVMTDFHNETNINSVHPDFFVNTPVVKMKRNYEASYPTIDEIYVYSPGPYLRDEDVYKSVLEDLCAYIDKYSSYSLLTPNRANIYMLAKPEMGEMYLRSFDISKYTPTNMEHADVFYGHGFTDWHNDVIQRMSTETKGVVMLHGAPGTGKTNYIRHLLKELTSVNKRVIYVPPGMVESILQPSFLQFLIDEIVETNMDTILLIEDAEPLLESRNDAGRTTGISNLLNSTDGLLNDILGLIIICTFNTDLTNIDDALLRPGRLLARKEFREIDSCNVPAAAKILGVELEDSTSGGWGTSKTYTIAQLANMGKNKSVLVHNQVSRKNVGFK